MFKNYLRIQPKGVQLAVFLFIWSGCYLISDFALPLLIKMNFGIGRAGVNAFLENDVFNHPVFFMLINALSAFLIFFLPSFLFAYLAHPGPLGYLGMKRPGKTMQWFWVVVLALGMIPVLTTLGGWIMELNLGASAKALQEVRETNIKTYLKAADIANLALNVFFIALVPAICEELFFRGIVQKFAYSFLRKSWAAILVSGILFALLHFTVYEFVPIFLAGLLLAWVYQTTGSIWLNILLHFLNNGLQVVIAYFAVRSSELKKLDDNTVFAISISVLGLILLGISLTRLYTTRTPLPGNWSIEEPEEENKINLL